MAEENTHKDLTGALKALEGNNRIVPPAEAAKRQEYIAKTAESTAASLIRPLRTLEDDAARFIKEEKQSLWTIREADRKKNPQKIILPRPKRKPLMVLLSVLVAIGIVSFGLYFTLLRLDFSNGNPLAPISYPSIVPNQKTVVVTPEAFSKLLIDQVSFKQGAVTYVRIASGTTPIAADVVLGTLSSAIPGGLLRTIQPDGYMLGITGDETPNPFLALTVNSRDIAFAGMLAWEPKLATLFDKLRNLTTTTTGVFQDAVVKGKDARILRDNSGNAHILYSFYDTKTLIITTNEIAFGEILAALQGNAQ